MVQIRLIDYYMGLRDEIDLPRDPPAGGGRS